ncbi:hypothetical protein GCM10022233_77170 [Streptomyces shaanxiensis]|uniref:Uncharacterized protein n=2 Tax=Streptomyces shaanxiensis TaxID=653357 RepID=A0ABP7W8Z3_9ACTN
MARAGRTRVVQCRALVGVGVHAYAAQGRPERLAVHGHHGAQSGAGVVVEQDLLGAVGTEAAEDGRCASEPVPRDTPDFHHSFS